MVTFKGGTHEQMRPFADSLRAFMMDEMHSSLKWVHSDYDKSVATVSVDLDSDEASRLGLNRALLSLSIAKTLNGQTVASYWEGDKSIPINFYNAVLDKDMSYEDLGNQLVTTPIPGVYVPLRQIADVTPSWQPIGLAHSGGEQSITVFASIASLPAFDSMITPCTTPFSTIASTTNA